MKWEKLGLVFVPDRDFSWSRSHASAPTPLCLEDSRYRIFFASRDENNRSHVGFFDIDLEIPSRQVVSSSDPVLAPGPLGHFDDHGVYPSSAVKVGKSVWLYTIGWNPGAEGPLFYSSIGLSISEDEGRSFEKYGQAPIMARSDHDPCLVTAPMVLLDQNKWRMWYVSGYRWQREKDGLHSCYHVKYAESSDGISWRRDGHVALDHASPAERNIARPCVVRDEGGYRAWYSYNAGSGYRIGYAESSDGLHWVRRDDQAGISLSPSGWDSEAIAYPYVVKCGNRLFMFYNGNGFGRDGIGLAVADA